MNVSTVASLALCLFAGTESAHEYSPARSFAPRCQILAIDDVQLPALQSGPLVKVVAREGQAVSAKELLAQIDDTDAQVTKLQATLQRDAALARAADDIEVRYAQASLEVARQELQMNLDVNDQSGSSLVSLADIRRLRLAKHRAELQVDRSRMEFDFAKKSARAEEANVISADKAIDRCRLVAPFSGTVVEVYRQQSEWVTAGDPVLRLVRMDTLWVNTFLSARSYNPEDVDGRAVTVEIERARGQTMTFKGRIVHVSSLVHGNDNYRIRAEVKNIQRGGRWLLQPGRSVSLRIEL